MVVAEGAQQGIDLVRIAQVERGMFDQPFDFRQRARATTAGLDLQPLVDHQRLVFPARIKSIQGLLAFPAFALRQHTQTGELVGHVVGAIELLFGHDTRCGAVCFAQVTEAEIAQRAASRILCIGPITVLRRKTRITSHELGAELFRQEAAQAVARSVQRIGIDNVQLFRQRRFAG